MTQRFTRANGRRFAVCLSALVGTLISHAAPAQNNDGLTTDTPAEAVANTNDGATSNSAGAGELPPIATVNEALDASIDGAAMSLTLPPTTPRPDLLERLRSGFALPEIENRAIDQQLNWYAGNPAYLERVFGRAELYLHHIANEVEARNMPREIALLPVIESAFEPFAYSRARASGLWQFIPDTGKRFGLPQTWWYDGRRDVLESTRAALDYLQFMHDEFNGDWLLAVAGYNCGENCVARAIRENRARGLPIDFFSLRLPAETRAYVPKLLAMSRLVATPDLYGIAFTPIPNEPYFVKVETDGQVNLKLAAQLAGITPEELFELNPAFHRWATPPQGPHHLLLPIPAADLFRESIAQLTPDERLQLKIHKVGRGETLAAIAKNYHTQSAVLRQINDLGTGPLVVGGEMRVPAEIIRLPEKVTRAAARVDGGSRSSSRSGKRPRVHVVRRGDSLWAISRRTGVDMQTLARLNGLKPNEKLRAGDRLVIAKASPSSSRGTSTSRDGSSVRYTVRRGDTLYGIARLYNVSVTQLRRWNGMKSSASIKAGQRLIVFLPQRR